MGDLPPYSARPWKLFFHKSNVDMSKLLPQDCKVMFNSQIKAVSYAPIKYESFPEPYLEIKSEFDSFLRELPNIERGSFSISTFNVFVKNGSDVFVTLILRNGSDKALKLEKLPITIKDENNQIISSEEFQLDNFIVNSMKARVYSVAIKANVDLGEVVETDKWTVNFQK